MLRQSELDAPHRLGTLGSRERAHSTPRISPERDLCPSKMCIRPSKMCIRPSKMYIRPSKMYIRPSKMYIIPSKMEVVIKVLHNP